MRPFQTRIASETLWAAAASVVALSVVALSERRGALQPLNATSHWLNGDQVARDRRAGLRTTAVGLGTHVAATAFWAAIYEAWLARGRRSRPSVLGKAAAMGGIAALVDYRATPKRFTPGWEFVLSPLAMTFAYVAMSLGFAVGACRADRSS